MILKMLPEPESQDRHIRREGDQHASKNIAWIMIAQVDSGDPNHDGPYIEYCGKGWKYHAERQGGHQRGSRMRRGKGIDVFRCLSDDDILIGDVWPRPVDDELDAVDDELRDEYIDEEGDTQGTHKKQQKKDQEGIENNAAQFGINGEEPLEHLIVQLGVDKVKDLDIRPSKIVHLAHPFKHTLILLFFQLFCIKIIAFLH